ncbi:MAG: hypothetical protein ACI4XM_00440 [Candidatus Coprovivens sp.]
MNYEQNNSNTQGNNGMPNNQNIQVSQNQQNYMQNSNLQTGMEQLNTSIQQNANYPNSVAYQQPTTNDTSNDDLIKFFIGKNYEKITTRNFNFAGFFFAGLYMFYRKMFLYGILFYLISLTVSLITNNLFISLLLNILVGLFVNKLYLYFVNKRIEKIKIQNPNKSIDDIKLICMSKGGTSIGLIFWGFFSCIGIQLIVSVAMIIMGFGDVVSKYFNINNFKVIINKNDSSSNNDSDKEKDDNTILAEDVNIIGYTCILSNCTISIGEIGNTLEYKLKVNNADLFKELNNYSDYIRIDVYYTQKGDVRTITDFKIYLKINNEEISNSSSVNELRTKIGLYLAGTHSDSLTLKKIGSTGIGYDGDYSYTYTEFLFVSSKNIEYKMKYINYNNSLILVEGNTYNVTFEVIEEDLEYDFYIKEIK